MIDQQCKNFLLFLIGNTPDYEDQVYTYDWLEENYTEPLETVYRMVRFLEPKGYVKTATRNGISFGISLEQPGYSFEEFAFEKAKLFFAKSILTPIFVSVVTTLITLWLQSKL